MILKFIKSSVFAFLIFVAYIFLFYTDETPEPKQDLNKKIEEELASYEAKLDALKEKEMAYNNLMQELKALRSNKKSKIDELLSSVELTSVLRSMSEVAKRHELSIVSFDVKPVDVKFAKKYEFTVKFRGSYLKTVSLFEDQNFIPTNASIKSFSIQGPVSNSKYVLTETELKFVLFKEGSV